MKDVSFRNYRGGTIDQRSEDAFHVSDVSVTFGEQKNGEKWDKSTHEATLDPLTNPARVFSPHSFSIMEVTRDDRRHAYMHFHGKGSTRPVSYKGTLEHLRRIADALGEENLSFYLTR